MPPVSTKYSDMPIRAITITIIMIFLASAIALKEIVPDYLLYLTLIVTVIAFGEIILAGCKAYFESPIQFKTDTVKSVIALTPVMFAIFILGFFGLNFSPSYVVGLLLVSAFGYDAMALMTGRCFGRKFFKYRPIPHISPNKTWEGYVGGWIASIIASLSYIFVLQACGLPILIDGNIIIACTGCFWASLGDLCGSRLKRLAMIKDYSNLLPGHGGFTDRFISLYIVAVIYFLTFSLPMYLRS